MNKSCWIELNHGSISQSGPQGPPDRAGSKNMGSLGVPGNQIVDAVWLYTTIAVESMLQKWSAYLYDLAICRVLQVSRLKIVSAAAEAIFPCNTAKPIIILLATSCLKMVPFSSTTFSLASVLSASKEKEMLIYSVCWSYFIFNYLVLNIYFR